jgi:biotin carboxyl carrier protein
MAPVHAKRAPVAAGDGSISAPMPGSIFQMKTKEGDAVQAGQILLVMEAMKMENPIRAPFNGTVAKVFVREGDNVGEGDLLVEVARPEMTTL